VQTNNFYLSGNWTLFNGFQNYRLMQIAKLDEYANQLNTEVERRNVKMSVTGAYLQTVLNYQLVLIQEKRMALTKEQRDRMKLLFEERSATQLDYYELVAQFALDSSEYLRLIGEYRIANNQLKQILNFPSSDDFLIDLQPHINPRLIDFEKTTPNAPEITAIDVQNQITEMRIDNARSRLVPTLSVNGSLGTGYSGNNQQVINGNLQPKPLPVQMQENFYQSAVLSLTVPIFNQGNVRSDMERNKVEQLKITEERSFLSRELNYKIAQLHIEIQQFQNRL
jgi:outer membrane protein